MKKEMNLTVSLIAMGIWRVTRQISCFDGGSYCRSEKQIDDTHSLDQEKGHSVCAQ